MMIEGNENHAYKRWYSQLNIEEIRKMNKIHNWDTMMRFKFPGAEHRDTMFEDGMFVKINWKSFLESCKIGNV